MKEPKFGAARESRMREMPITTMVSSIVNPLCHDGANEAVLVRDSLKARPWLRGFSWFLGALIYRPLSASIL